MFDAWTPRGGGLSGVVGGTKVAITNTPSIPAPGDS